MYGEKKMAYLDWAGRASIPPRAEAPSPAQGMAEAGSERINSPSATNREGVPQWSNRPVSAATMLTNSPRSARSGKLFFKELDDPAERVRKYLKGDQGRVIADLVLEFDDSDGCIYMAKHYVTAVSTVWAGLLDKGELGDDKGARNSRSKTPSAPYKTTTADASIDRRYFRVSNKKYQDVLEFWAICYASDDEILTVTEDNLEIMIELAAEWKVLCVLHKCERLLCKQLVHLRYHSTGWKALAMADGMCGCVGADRRPIMDCDECDVENVLRKLAWVATLASKHQLSKTWNLLLKVARDIPLTLLTNIIDSHPAFDSVGFELRYAILVHVITDEDDPTSDGAAVAAGVKPAMPPGVAGSLSAMQKTPTKF